MSVKLFLEVVGNRHNRCYLYQCSWALLTSFYCKQYNILSKCKLTFIREKHLDRLFAFCLQSTAQKAICWSSLLSYAQNQSQAVAGKKTTWNIQTGYKNIKWLITSPPLCRVVHPYLFFFFTWNMWIKHRCIRFQSFLTLLGKCQTVCFQQSVVRSSFPKHFPLGSLSGFSPQELPSGTAATR